MRKLGIAIVVSIILFSIWFFYFRWTKDKAIGVIISNKQGRTINDAFTKFDEDFLIDWAKGIKSGSTNFINKGKSYITSTGKAG